MGTISKLCTLPLVLILCLCLTCAAEGQRQPFRFEHITVEDGLPEASVISVLQDRLGFLWLGTGQGLVRYDGYTVEVFEPDPNDPGSIGRGPIRGLYEDERGALWVSTAREGLYRFDRRTEQFTRYLHDPDDPNSLTSNQVAQVELPAV